jgi:hypothetical protein
MLKYFFRQHKKNIKSLILKLLNMKHLSYCIIIAALLIISQGFQCGRGRISDNCNNQYNTDSIILPFNVINSSATYRVGDTIKLASIVNDSILTQKGKSFINPREYFSTQLQPYKVVTTGSVKELNYANIEFNPLVNIGQFQIYAGAGFSFTYQRNSPLNKLNISIVAGKVGLYLFKLSNNQYGINRVSDGDICTNYFEYLNFPVANQNNNYWDSIGVTKLSLASTSGYELAKKGDRDYFFVKVIP